MEDNKRPDGTILLPWAKKPPAWDITVPDTYTQSHIIDTVSTVHSRPVGRQLINLHIDADPIVMRTQVTIIRQLCQVRRCLPASTFQSLVQTLYFTAGLWQRRHDRPPCLSDAAATVGFQFGCEADLWTSAV